MMSSVDNRLVIAQQTLWQPAALDVPQLTRVLEQMLGRGADYADLYFQRGISESWSLEESEVKDGSYSVGGGVGVRALSQEKCGFSYSDQIELGAIEQAAQAAASVAQGPSQGKSGVIQAVTHGQIGRASWRERV